MKVYETDGQSGWVIRSDRMHGGPSYWFGANRMIPTTWGSLSMPGVEVFPTKREAEAEFRSVFGRFPPKTKAVRYPAELAASREAVK